MRAIFYFVLAFILALVVVGTILVISYNNDVARNYTEVYNTVAPVLGLA